MKTETYWIFLITVLTLIICSFIFFENSIGVSKFSSKNL